MLTLSVFSCGVIFATSIIVNWGQVCSESPHLKDNPDMLVFCSYDLFGSWTFEEVFISFWNVYYTTERVRTIRQSVSSSLLWWNLNGKACFLFDIFETKRQSSSGQMEEDFPFSLIQIPTTILVQVDIGKYGPPSVSSNQTICELRISLWSIYLG